MSRVSDFRAHGRELKVSWLTPATAAKRLRVSREYVYALVKRGLLDAFHLVDDLGGSVGLVIDPASVAVIEGRLPRKDRRSPFKARSGA